jgi:hypothetical protein
MLHAVIHSPFGIPLGQRAATTFNAVFHSIFDHNGEINSNA